jgi:hypothetical protein
MKQSNPWLMLGIAALLSVPLAHADDSTTTVDTSIVVADDGESASDVVNHIALPDSASDTASEHAAFGQSVANQAHDRGDMTGREFGQSVADQVRQDVQGNQHAAAGAGNAGTHGRP